MMEQNPFIFGKAVEGSHFTDREEDTKRLKANLTHGISTALISPRRWGKTSLVKKVMSEIDEKEICIVFVDIFSCKSEYEFYRTFATAIIKHTSGKMEEWIEAAKTFFTNITPKFSFGTDPMNDFSISFEWDKKYDYETDILQLPERIAKKKGIRVVVCFDEFQQIAEFNDSITFQKKLRTAWQHQQLTTYCLFGSKKHRMTDIFSRKESPFYKFGDMMFLSKISTEKWVEFICRQFSETGKSITPSQAEKICIATENMSSYVQHLSWIIWYQTEKDVTDKIVDKAIVEIMEQNRVFFQREIDQLTEMQLNFLCAIADGVNDGFSRMEILRKYRLENSANVQVVKRALIKKDLIDVEKNNITFNDPIFKLWIKKSINYI